MLRSLVLALLLAVTSAFVAPSAPQLASASPRQARPAVTMAGWQDPYEQARFSKSSVGNGKIKQVKSANAAGNAEFNAYMEQTNKQAEMWNIAGGGILLLTCAGVLIKVL